MRSPVADLRPESPPAAIDDEQERVEHHADDEGDHENKLEHDHDGDRHVANLVVGLDDIQRPQRSFNSFLTAIIMFAEQRLSAMHSQTRMSSCLGPSNVRRFDCRRFVIASRLPSTVTRRSRSLARRVRR